MDVAEWLRGLGLEQYSPAFRDNDIDGEVLRRLTAEDLRELGVASVGHRRRLLDAIAAVGTAEASPAPAPAAAVSGEAERRQLTVMFCDLVGSTPLSVRFDPEDLREIVGVYHSCVAETVGRFAGFVAKYMGDGVLVYFGYPEAHEDDAERAVRAGLAVIEAVGRLTTLERLNVRLGIASGLVVVGDLIGTGAAQERGVVGETPNLAARLQTLAPPGTLVIADSTRRQIGAFFDIERLGPQPIAGFAEPRPAWRVLGESGVVSRFEALRSEPAPLVDRDEELALLLRRWQQARAGEGRVVLISGEAGIGKSRLTAALSQRIESDQHIRLRYFCSPYHQDSAFYPFIVQLERAARFARNDTTEEKVSKMRGLLAPAASSEDEIELLAELLSLPNSAADQNLSPQRKREKLFKALLHQFEALALARPVLMIFEDAHWIDPSSRELLDLTIDRLSPLPVLLVVTFRPEFQHGWSDRPQVATMALNRLGRRDGLTLLERVAGDAALACETVDEIIERTDGVPLFIEELTKAVLETGARGGEAAALLAAGAIPATLHASLIARLDRLGPLVKEVAQVGAVIGREFSYELIEPVAQQPVAELRLSLDRLVEAGLLFCRGVAPQSFYVFKHALIQDAAHGTLLRGRRQELHARVAKVLEEQFPEIQPQILAQHFTEAGSLKKAAAYWCRAGRQSAAKSAVVEAIGQLRAGVQLVSSIPDNRERKLLELELQVALGGALRWAKGDAHPEVIGAFGRARDLLLETEGAGTIPHFSVLYGLWSADYIGGKPLGALDHANEFLSLAQSQNATELCSMGNRLIGTALIAIGDYSTALSHLEHAAISFAPEEHQEADFRFGVDLRVTVLDAWAWTLWHAGFPDQADGAANQAVRCARQSDHPLTLVYALTHVGLIAVSGRRTTEVEEIMREVIAISDEQGFRLFLAWALMLQGWIMARRRVGKDAVDCIRKGLDISRTTGSRAQEPMFLGLLAEVLALSDATDEGLAVLVEALAIAQNSGAKGNNAELYRLRGDLLQKLPSPDWTEVELSFHTSLAVAREQGTRGFELRAAVSLARLRRAQDRPTEARGLLAPVYGWFTEGFDTPDLKEAKVLLDELQSAV